MGSNEVVEREPGAIPFEETLASSCMGTGLMELAGVPSSKATSGEGCKELLEYEDGEEEVEQEGDGAVAVIEIFRALG